MHPWLSAFLFMASAAANEPAPHRIDVRIAGALAMVEVWHPLDASPQVKDGQTRGAFLDVALPAGAAVLDWELLDGRERTPLGPSSEVKVNAALSAALKLRQWVPPVAQPDEGADFRVHVTPIADRKSAVLHLRYAAPIGCLNGKLALRMPESPEENPSPPQVTVAIEAIPDGARLVEASLARQPAQVRPGARRLVMHGTAPARAPWDITWRYDRGTGTFDGQALAAAARTRKTSLVHGRARSTPQYLLEGLVCRSDTPEKSEPPGRVFLLVDRSRSVGQGGLSAERLFARGLLDALPPSVSFNAILFARDAVPVFPLPRLATREALDLFSSAADPNRLDNGSDVVTALSRVRKLTDLGDPAQPTWIAIVTDGALPPGQTAERMRTALAGLDNKNLRLLVLFVRQPGDDDVPARTVSEYAQLVAHYGGVVRVVPPGNPGDGVREILSAMGKGGDLLDVRVERSALAAVLPPGQGASGTAMESAKLPRDRRVRFSASALAGEVSAIVTPVSVDLPWIEPLLSNGTGPVATRQAWSGANTTVAVAILPPPPSATRSAEPVVRGRMDPVVLRNALALGFMPRARACYLSRRVARAGDARLQGRIKLELTIERGELHDAVIRSSTLNHPEVEACVRKAAWAIDFPRPEHRDAPTVANLNLVFRPHSPEERAPDAGPLDREIELILGPLSFPTDFKDLLEERPPGKSSSP